MQTTVNVPHELVDVFRAELADTVAQAADRYAEAARSERADREGCLVDLREATELHDAAPYGPGDVTGGPVALAATARGVLIQLTEDLADVANRAELDPDLITMLAEQVKGWGGQVARLEREARDGVA